MARFIAEKLEIGKNIKEILKKHNINIMDGLEAVKELQQRVYLILLDGEKVISNESNMFIKLGALRYEV